MSAKRKPLFLLADSQLLFRSVGNTLLTTLQDSLQVSHRSITRAAYIGAANGDAPEFFEIFVAAMDGINLHDSRMIRAKFGSADREFLEQADLLLLAGGDTDDGWKLMTSTGMDALITKKYYTGAVVIGVSAGAVQLGMGWYRKDDAGVADGLKIVPHYIDVHSERDDWYRLRRLVAAKEQYAKGYGIPSCGALIYHADMSMEAVRYPVAEFAKPVNGNGRLTANLLLPGAPSRAPAGALRRDDRRHPIGESLS